MERRQTPGTKADLVECEGVVRHALANDLFEVELAGGRRILAHPDGPVRHRAVRLGTGVRVRVSLFRYDPSRGRIVSVL